ncbi:MAG TPA: hypothetical protein DCY13_20915, partial [Verrucomicrobiales bacterium]|nr:hypothetical protein [Verrucomicrobiales bacterium]
MKSSRWLWLLLLLPVAFGLYRLRFDTEVLHLLPTDLPEVRGLRAWQEHFAGAGQLMITLTGDNAAENARVAEAIASRLREVPGLTGDVHWQAPWREHPGGMAELAAARWLNQPADVVDELVAQLDPTRVEARLKGRREQLAFSLSPDELARLSYDPLGLLDVPGGDGAELERFGDEGPFATASGQFRVIHVQPPDAAGDYRRAEDWLQRVRRVVYEALVASQSAEPPVVKFTGGPAFLAEIGRDMETDMKRSVMGTAIVVALLFALVHRRLRPLLWLVTLCGLVLLFAMAAGGLIFQRLNVVSLGFAAILLGLVVDYGLVLYQERLANAAADWRSVRREVAPGIFWSAITTACAFALLNFGGLPGLAQLGTLVAVGILIGAAVITGWLLGPLESIARAAVPPPAGEHPAVHPPPAWRGLVPALLLLIAAAYVGLRPPVLDASSAPLRPGNSPAYVALDELREEIGGEESWAVLIAGRSEQAVADALAKLEQRLADLQRAGSIEGYALPTALMPSPERHRRGIRA